MNKWKILFVGVGSIAKRHIKNLVALLQEQGSEYIIDLFRSGKGAPLPEEVANCVNTVYFLYENVPKDYDIVFITNPTQYHLVALKQFHDNGSHFFIEKPLCGFDQIGEAGLDYLRPQSVYYVACPLRYTEVIQYIKQNINPKDVYSVRCISSSYLPDWRPDVDYRDSYSAHKELGGGVSIDLIHEWDYICYLFGKPQKIKCIVDKVSDLEIDSDDIAIYLAKYDSCTVEIHLDYFGRKSIRQLQLFTKNDTILCDLVECSVTFMKSDRKLCFNAERDTYQKKELQYFFKMLEEGVKNPNDIEMGRSVLGLTGGMIT